MRASLRYVQVLAAAVAAFAGSPAMAADAAQGGVLAKRWCGSCHLVESDQKQANADVPSFEAIASKSDFTPEKVALFLLEPHPKMPMPNFQLTRTEAADVAAYIGSLRK